MVAIHLNPTSAWLVRVNGQVREAHSWARGLGSSTRFPQKTESIDVADESDFSDSGLNGGLVGEMLQTGIFRMDCVLSDFN